MLKALLVTLPFLAACTQQDYFPNAKKVLIDGELHLVRPLRPGVYQALPDVAPGSVLIANDPRIWGRNVKAIQQATGCKIVDGSVGNDFTITIAAVDCQR